MCQVAVAVVVKKAKRKVFRFIFRFLDWEFCSSMEFFICFEIYRVLALGDASFFVYIFEKSEGQGFLFLWAQLG